MAGPAVLAHTGLTLCGGPGEIDAGDRCALPVRRLRGKPILVEGLDPELAQITKACGKACACDHLVDLEGDLPQTGRSVGVDPVAVTGSLDRFQRDVNDKRAAPEQSVLERLYVSRAGRRRE